MSCFPAPCVCVCELRSVLLAISAAGQTRLVCAMPRLLNCPKPEVIDFEILFSPIACDITISLGTVLYVLIDYITLYQLLSLPSVHTARRY